jgi:P4 family phage/plasmid primase-like protien
MTDHLFREFINKFRSQDDKNYTHTSQMQPFTGKFYIENSKMEEFWDMYCNHVYSRGAMFMSGLSEKPNTYMPVLGDIDIQVGFDETKEYNEPLYITSQLKKIVSIYIDVLKFILQDIDYDNLVCFVLEKTKPYINGPIVKNGFHIHFPFLYLSQVDQEIHLVPRVIKEVEEQKLFENIGYEHSGDVIDKGVCKKHWLMYGSRKDSKLEAYKLTTIFNYNCNEIKLADVMKKQSIYNCEGDVIDFTKSKHPVEYYLPRILSVHPLYRPRGIIRENLEVIVKQKLIKVKELKGTYENMSIPEAIAICRKLVALLKDERASHHDTWIEIGWILYNIGEGSYEALEIWLQFSRRTTRGNYNEAICVSKWNSFYKANFTLGSLKMHAKADNPQGFAAYCEDEKKKRIDDSLNGGHYDLARQLYDIYGDKYVCGSIEKDVWFEYRNHRWIKDDKGIELKKKIAAALIPRYKDEAKKTYDNVQPADDGEAEIDQNNSSFTKIKKINSIIGCLNTSGFKSSVMKECQELFYKSEFLDKLDNDPYLLGFNNGVLDLKTCTFREGRPTDFISYSVGYDYREFSMSDIEIQDIEFNLEKIFVDPVLRDYFINYASTLLRGGNFQKTFVVMSGEGDNGKSVIIDLLDAVLGEYVIKLPTSLIIGKRTQSSAASPELARIQGKRFAVLQEPDGKDVINGGILKELTGNDSIYVRGLFKEGTEIKPMIKLTLICNKLPKLTADEPAIWNRVRVLLYESKFPKDQKLVPKTYEEQKAKKIFPRDNDFGEKIPGMRAPFLWYIFQRYKILSKKKLSEIEDPEKVTEATRNYRENNDYVLQFINENVKQDFSPENEGLSLSDIFNMYKEWFQNTYTGIKCTVNKIELREDLGKRWGKQHLGRWKHYRFRTLLDDEEDEKVAIYNPNDNNNENTVDDEEEKYQ